MGATYILTAALTQLDTPHSSSSSSTPSFSAPTPGNAPSPALALGPHHLLRTRLHAQLLKASIDHGAHDAWPVALRSARVLTHTFELVYPHPWPALALHHATVAKLEMLLHRPGRARKVAVAALQGLRVTHAGFGGVGSGGGSGAAGAGEEGVEEQVLRVAREAEGELRARREQGMGLEGSDVDE